MLLSPCGIDCGSCNYKESCNGCHAIAGKPFYIKDFGMETCPLYECPVSQKGYHTCAECDELPCELYQSWRDPSMSDEQHQASIVMRVKNLKG